MHSVTRELLLDAFQRGALFGVHIDLQKKLHAPLTTASNVAYNGVKKASEHLRHKGIENIWCAMRTKEYYPTELLQNNTAQRAKDTPLNAQDVFATVMPSDDEIVVIKKTTSIAQTPYFKQRFQSATQPVFLLDGVSADICVLHSAIGIVSQLREAHVMLVPEGINLGNRNPDTYLKKIKNHVSPEQASRLHTAHLDEVIAGL